MMLLGFYGGGPIVVFSDQSNAITTSSASTAQVRTEPEGKPSLRAIRVQKGPEIDGRLDEALWKESPAAGPLWQYDPLPGVEMSGRSADTLGPYGVGTSQHATHYLFGSCPEYNATMTVVGTHGYGAEERATGGQGRSDGRAWQDGV